MAAPKMWFKKVVASPLLGLHVSFDGVRPINEQVIDVTICCIECDVPTYEPLDLDRYYRAVSQSFIGEGGDDYTMLSDNRINVEVIGVDYDVLMTYIRQQSPVFAEAEGRIEISDACLAYTCLINRPLLMSEYISIILILLI